MLQITLNAVHHAFIIAFLPQAARGEKDVFKYISQVANNYDPAQDNAQPITVNTTPSMVANLFFIMGQQQERLTTNLNNEIKEALIPQVAGSAETMQLLTAIMQKNAEETQAVINAGFDFIKEIK
jgi:hypothetical protein